MSSDKKKNEETSKIIPRPIKNKFYFSFTIRFIILIICFFLTLTGSIFFLVQSIILKDEKIINYSEKSNLNYTVCLMENNFYKEQCISKNMKYVASLIKNININFTYDFEVGEPKSINFTYDIKGKLIISDKKEEKSFYENEYILKEGETKTLDNGNKLEINENLEIDYNYYNSIANQFISSYGVDSDSKFLVYLEIKKENINNDDIFEAGNDSLMSVSIPLSQRAIDISLDYKDLNESSSIISKKNIAIKNYLCGIISAASALISITIVIKIIRNIALTRNRKNYYDKYIDKILNQYERLIAETSSLISFEGKDVIKFKKFSELLNVHDNLGVPIMYYTVTKHTKCFFYLVHDNVIYLYIVKSVDLENSNEEN